MSTTTGNVSKPSEARRVSHQEDEQGYCYLDSSDCLALPRAVDAHCTLVYRTGREQCSIHVDRFDDITKEMS